jgi:hypothetical protein
MHDSLPPIRGVYRARPIGVREGRRANLLKLLRDFGIAGESRGKTSEKLLLKRLLVDPAVACRKPRPKVVAAPPVTAFLLVEIPRRLEGKWGRPRQPDKKS